MTSSNDSRWIPRRQPKPKPFSMEQLLPALRESLGLDHKVAELAVCRLWETLIPESYKPHVKAVGLVEKPNPNANPYHSKPAETLWTLELKASHGSYASEINLMAPALCEQMNTYAVQTGIRLASIVCKTGR